ncbi:hypothetical protein OO256_26715 [Pseudomonas sp. DCB_CB]|uniref:hypothetical protein n=1 Tax=unclassified Pseudomonas TaxID=196821 RepID=UPI002248AB37|nr:MULTISPECIES: hypothetical protein [unclassified Pseudomonas]MCX2694492.1 hypothetical protein [Pseudomonas sp. DCB_BZ]MCX2859678.1 hypothetical protein [Pseudomonas sp. DCB_CB]
MDNRQLYLDLLKRHDISQKRSAILVAAITQRPCSERTVRSWLNDPEKPSSRPCPDWALSALRKAIEYMIRAVEKRKE